ncbi:hypothetical protein [Microbacterium sp.]|uniref:hypothetical protein n=1 Tax=Microbacterium sp. TaxID=51671 RepID=UPI0039E23451
MKKRILITSLAVCGALGLGSVAGTAVAVGPILFAPTGVASAEESQPMPEPSYEKNSAGLTYGSAAVASSPNNEPDLIQAETTDGRTGYVLKVELDRATGSLPFDSPADALRWQETEGVQDRTIPVYEEDGKTVIGEFLIVGSETQATQQSETK